MKPMYALHTDAKGNVLAAKDFDADYQLQGWIRDRDIRPGDKITFAECSVRADEPDPAPAFIETPAPAPSPTPVGDDQPF